MSGTEWSTSAYSGLRSLAAASSARVLQVKEIVDQRGYRALLDPRKYSTGDSGYQDRQSWTQWAGNKIRRRGSADQPGTEHIMLFPGWASERANGAEKSRNGELDVYVSGYVYRLTSVMSHPQRVFVGLAKAFARLPKLPVSSGTSTPIPEEGGPFVDDPTSKYIPPEEIEMELSGSDSMIIPLREYQNETQQPSEPMPQVNPNDAHNLHQNFTDRLRPFLAKPLTERYVRLIYHITDLVSHKERVHVRVVPTTPQGTFQVMASFVWVPPPEVDSKSSRTQTQHFSVQIDAELLPPNPATCAIRDPVDIARSHIDFPLSESRVHVVSDVDDTIKHVDILGGTRAVVQNVFVRHLKESVIKGMGPWYKGMFDLGARFHYVSNGPLELYPVLQQFLAIAGLPKGSVKLKSYAGRSLVDSLLSAPADRKRGGVLSVMDHFRNSKFILIGDSGEQDLELYADIAAERPNQVLAIFIRDARDYDTTTALDDPLGIRTPLTDALALFTSPNASLIDLHDSPQDLKPPPSLPARPPPPYTVSPSGKGPGSISYPLPIRPHVQANPRAFSEPRPLDSKQGGYPINQPNKGAPYMLPRGPSPVPAVRSAFSTEHLDDKLEVYADSSPSCSMSRSRSPEPLSPAEKKRQELQTRVCKARTVVPRHIPLRVFRHPNECFEGELVIVSELGDRG